MDFRPIGKNIRKYRLQRKLRQEDLAEKAGLSNNYVGALERGEKIPSLDTMIGIANALNVSMDVLLCDVLNCGYETKASLFADRLNELSERDRAFVFNIVEVLIEHFAEDKD